MKKLPLFLSLLLLFSCDEFPLTDSEIAAGLKSALEVGSNYALKTLGAEDGFLLDQAVKILLPEDAANLVKAAAKVPVIKDIVKQLEADLLLTLNRAAEASIEGVIPIVIDAVTGMTINDAKNILFAPDDRAATHYLIEKTYNPLCEVCGGVIEEALNRKIVLGTSAQEVWGKLTGYYNQVAVVVPSLKPIETNLALYTTQKALDGVFLKVGDEEIKIRTDVNARVNDLLRRVFGQLD
jgi:hypothetical protein